MEVFSIELRLLGEMSQLPDSQKVFGALMYFLAQNNYNVSKFVHEVKEGNTYFALSNVMPQDYLPVPKSFIEYKARNIINDKGKAVYSALKNCDFANKELLIKYQNNPGALLSSCKKDDFISLEIDQQVHINTEGIDEDSGEEKNLIFSIQKTNCNYNRVSTESKKYKFYIRCEENCAVVKLLEDNLKYVFTLGKRSSQGYNLFELISVTRNSEIEKLYANQKNTYLNLGMLLPNEICFTDENSFLNLFSSERRTFSSDKWSDEDNRGYFISFIAPGSMVVSNDIMKAGKCVDSPNKKGEIVFGNAFLLPWEA